MLASDFERAADEVDLVHDAEHRRRALAARSDHAERVRVVDQEPRAVLLHDLDDLVDLGDLALGAEDPVGDDERALFRLELFERLVERFGVVVPVAHEPCARGLAETRAVVE